MPTFSLLRVLGCGTTLLALFGTPVSGLAAANSLTDLVGQWDFAQEGGARPCRITLSAGRSDKGDYFAAVPGACRRTMPVLARVGRWTLSDPAHIGLSDPAGGTVLTLAADGEAFAVQGADGAVYKMTHVAAAGRRATADEAVVASAAKIDVTATHNAKTAPPERMNDMAGRYAILRDKTHDTGCMLTLDDKTRVKGGARAALAPACRDQGIVVFDPSAWQIVNGRLVLSAKAGHVTHLDKQVDGSWLKDANEGKSLSLKKL